MSLSASKTSGSIVAEILMLKTTHTGGFLLVEGEDDSLFWSARTVRSTCQIVIAGGKPNVMGAAAILDQRGDQHVLGYVDCDFDRAKGIPIASPRLTRTDTHDLETMMLSCLALRKVLVEIANHATVQSFELQGQTVFEAVLSKSKPFGKLRLLNDLRNYQVNFENLSPYKYFDIATWQLDAQRLENDFCNAAGIQHYVLQPALMTLPPANDLDLIQGHDALSILAIGLKGPLGGNKSYSEKEIASRLRTAMESQHLTATQLYGDLRTFESNFGLDLFAV